LRILITGGAGFIGRHLAEYLSKEHSITIYDNLSNSTKPEIQNIEFVKGDILDYKTLRKNSIVDIVIHLAAKINVEESMTSPEETMDVNVKGTENVCKCCVQNKIKKIIFASSAAVYGEQKRIITEQSQTNPLSPYAKSKLLAEEKIKSYLQKNNLDSVILRMFNVYGKGQNKQYAGVVSKFLENVLQNKPLIIYGNGKQTRDFISIHDVVKAFDCVLKSNKVGTYNIATGKSLSINDLVEIISDEFGKKLDVTYQDSKSGDIKDSIADVSLAENEIGFVSEKSLRGELSSIYHE